MKIKKEISAGGIVFKIQKPKTKIQKQEILWLVTQHSKFGHWSFPKGLVGDKIEEEGMEDAALREVEEEGGVKAEIVEKLPTPVNYSYRWENTLIKKTVHYFLMRYISGDPKDHDWEVSEAKFAPEEEVEKLLTFKNDKVAFRQVLQLLDKL